MGIVRDTDRPECAEDGTEVRSTGFWLPAATYFRFVGRHFVADASLNNKFYN